MDIERQKGQNLYFSKKMKPIKVKIPISRKKENPLTCCSQII